MWKEKNWYATLHISLIIRERTPDIQNLYVKQYILNNYELNAHEVLSCSQQIAHVHDQELFLMIHPKAIQKSR